MTFVGLAVAAALLVAGTVAAGSVPRVGMRLEERVVAGLVVTILVGSVVTYLLALAVGLSSATVLGGDAITALGFGAVAWPTRRPARARWTAEWEHLRSPSQHRHRLGMTAVAATASVIFGVLFAHTMGFDSSGNLNAGFQTVWADWSQHLTTMSSFATAHNLPPANPLFSGQDLRYPFLPDFQSATLMALGASAPVALALPGALLALCITVLIVLLAERLGAGLGAGALAAAITMIGGGLGFSGIIGDACLHHGFSATQCSWPGVVSHHADTLSIIAGTLHDLPGLVAAQPRAYDGLLTPTFAQPLPDQQWYTPLFAWWLPQRSLLYGFAGALVALMLVLGAVRTRRRGYESFALAGLLLGLMPLVHIHTLVAMSITFAVLALSWRHRGWWLTAAVAAVVAAPRLVSLLAGPHGSADAGNLFPTVEPGWMYAASGATRPLLSPLALLGGVGGLLSALVSPGYWAFWIANTGVAVPLCALVAVALAARALHAPGGAAARRLLSAFPDDLVRVAMALSVVFVVANLVVFQSWDWDNTKLLAYWYLGAALLIGALVSHLWRRWWRGAAAFVTATATLLTGALVLVRLLPWTPAADAVGGPYSTATAQDVRLAAAVSSATPSNAVFLTDGKPNDPVLTLAGRTAVMGYYGWLWSYGTDFGTRVADVRTMLEGCHSEPRSACAVFPLLRRYGVAYAEIDDRLTDAGVLDAQVDVRWWATQGFPVVARSDHVTVYDVRAP